MGDGIARARNIDRKTKSSQSRATVRDGKRGLKSFLKQVNREDGASILLLGKLGECKCFSHDSA